ncbi:SHOCT-like domain-containing protein [Ruminiclostridium cellobioparum]|jgi:DUF4097 and DUF4098 domain-containing protein YvlB|uniref:Uncharacterized protein n=1 Tax=Ruminiclostridium cellobioparum subsp. termitidis CT1112 TaxID=1195236 RepID=S0FS12_RUMCE|nr:DUF4097 family beta strand repeat-containing protein [Ruminiclostridium cellobioparum]EMS71964.1 hypothetical protein CTER_2027 [Ruminiclostridium cellobioparum subsp. termitidis CT1112]
MSISEERLLILKMVEEKKISTEEAAKLLAALEDEPKRENAENFNYRRNNKANGFADEAAKVRERVNEWKKEFKTNYNQADFDNMIDDFANKAEKFGKNVASTTAGIVDKVIDYVGSFVDTNSFNVFGSLQTVQKNYEVIPAEGANLEISGINGSITIKKHLDPKVMIISRIKSTSPTGEGIVSFVEDPSNISIKVNSTALNASVSHEVFVPDVKFNAIRIENSNGKIYIEDSLSQEVTATTKNAHIELMGVNSDNVSVTTKNGRVQMNYIIGNKIDINTSNAVIDIKHIKVRDVSAVTINGRINIENAQNVDDSEDMSMYLKTSNGGIKVNMNDMDNRVYKVKAHASNGSINLLIPEIVYHNVNRKGVTGSFVEAESRDYETGVNRVNITGETMNGQIEIVK